MFIYLATSDECAGPINRPTAVKWLDDRVSADLVCRVKSIAMKYAEVARRSRRSTEEVGSYRSLLTDLDEVPAVEFVVGFLPFRRLRRRANPTGCSAHLDGCDDRCQLLGDVMYRFGASLRKFWQEYAN